ncbi:MAG: amidohydrolase family protein [Actinomycetota bacterium]|nr:amidohydrolase family protein [Actinomycetota bacterium]
MSVLFKGGRVLTPGGYAGWALVDGAAIAATGAAGDEPDAERTVDLGGGVLLPAFCDAHVHLPATGLYTAGMDLRGERSSSAILDAFAERARRPDALLFGGNFEDPLDRPLTARLLDSAVGERPALLARADMHSCVVSSALLERLDVAGLEGVDVADGVPTGYLREQAAGEAWRWFDSSLPREQQERAIRAAVELAYSKGVASVHEMYVVEWRGWDSLDVFRDSVADAALGIVLYVATDDVARVRDMGLPRIGGDWFLDGSFGSHTAWLSEPYASEPPEGSPPAGISYRDDATLLELFREAQASFLQVGVHAIGDAAIEQAISTWEKVAAETGEDAVRKRGHRIEHFECASDDHIERAAQLGLKASVQPAFDHYWGGADGLYARRIGERRALQMNRFGTMAARGLRLGAGSDSTVTPLDPFLQMASLRDHHVEAERLDAAAALEMHTLGSRAMAGDASAGTIAAGQAADLVLVDRDPLTATVDELRETEVGGTWIGGRRVWPRDEAEAS